MRTIVTLVAAALLTLGLATAGSAHEVPSRVEMPSGDYVGYFSTENVEYVTRFPEHTGTAGGRLLDGYFYVTDPRGVYIYDVSDPAAPTLVGSTPLLQTATGAALAQEDPDTNGRILLVDAVDPDAPSPNMSLQVVDVSDKAAPTVIGSLPGVTDHTWTCVADCTYAYGRSGNIIDLTDPTEPVKLDLDWRQSVPRAGYTHDFTEVGPGRLFSAGQPSFYLDVTDPAEPRHLATIETRFTQLGYHGVEWALDGTAPTLVMGTEIAPDGVTNAAGSDCQGDGIIATYRTTDVLAAEAARPDGGTAPLDAEFELVDAWKVPGRGAFVDGNAPAHTLYCSHWFDLHPAFDGAGLIAAGYYDWGTRFLEVAEDGTLDEVGWFLPVDGYTASAYWITEDVVYAMDYRRGMEVLRFTGGTSGEAQVGTAPGAPTTPLSETVATGGDTATPAVASDHATTLPATGGSALLAGLGLLAVGLELKRRERSGAAAGAADGVR